jgi:hypothetical protein
VAFRADLQVETRHRLQLLGSSAILIAQRTHARRDRRALAED